MWQLVDKFDVWVASFEGHKFWLYWLGATASVFSLCLVFIGFGLFVGVFLCFVLTAALGAVAGVRLVQLAMKHR